MRPTVPSEQVIRRADVLWRSSLNGVLIRPLGTDEMVVLGGTGAALWATLDEPHSFAALCAALAETHDADVSRIADDLAPIVADLIARGALR